MSGNAMPEDYGETPEQYIHVDAQCACGKIRHIPVPAGDFEPVRITELPCTCGRFMCIIATEPVRQSTIDIRLEN